MRLETIKLLEENTGRTFFDTGLNNIFFEYVSGKGNKSKNKQIRLHQTKNFCTAEETSTKHKWNFQQNEKATYWMGEEICKWFIWQGVNIQNIQGTHITQHQENQTTQLKNGQRTWIDIFPEKTYRWPTGTWKDAQHH